MVIFYYIILQISDFCLSSLKEFYLKKEKELKTFFITDTSFCSWITSWHAKNKKERQQLEELIKEKKFDLALTEIIELLRKTPQNYLGGQKFTEKTKK